MQGRDERGISPPIPDQSTLREGSEPFVVELDKFEGPLSLLLHLIRVQDIDIFDIPLARVTRQFREAVEGNLDQVPLDAAGEFLEMAATLMKLKARMLLPRGEPEAPDEDPRAELVRRLLEYERFRQVAGILASQEADRRLRFGRGWTPPRPPVRRERPTPGATLGDLLAAALGIRDPDPPLAHHLPGLRVTVEQKIDLVKDLLGRSKRFSFNQLVPRARKREHVAASLLACLELARRRLLRLEQTAPFGSLWIFRRP